MIYRTNSRRIDLIRFHFLYYESLLIGCLQSLQACVKEKQNILQTENLCVIFFSCSLTELSRTLLNRTLSKARRAYVSICLSSTIIY